MAKTTTSLNVASSWAQLGKKVLLIDLDPQSSATKSIFGDREFDNSIYDVIMGRVPAEEAVVHSPDFEIDVIPAEILLSGIDVQLAAHFGRERILRKKIELLSKKYDSVIIDCSPSLGLMTINALMASKDIIIPICPEYFSLKGIELILQTLQQIRTGLGYKIGVRGVVITRFRDRRVVRDVIKQVREIYGLHVYTNFIPDNISVEEAHHHHCPVLKHDPACAASKAYMELSKEILL